VCYCEHVTDAGLELLATLPNLVSLDISGCNVQDHGVSSLGNSSRLRDITLSECRNITDLGLQVRPLLLSLSLVFPESWDVVSRLTDLG
jgi:F-box/leucine-rich repeat protein 13